MKKITLFALLLVAGFTASAQNFYTFSMTEGSYADLEGSTSINDGMVWDIDYFGEFEMPFSFSVQGHAVNRFAFDDDDFILLESGADIYESDEGIYHLSPSSLPIRDRDYGMGPSVSKLNYKVEGTVGNRILKLEVNNAGVQDIGDLQVETNYFYLNLQIWIYEADKAIEFRYGDNNISDLDVLTDGEGLMVGFGSEYSTLSIVRGSNNSPEYGEYTLATFPFTNADLDMYPEDGTVYRFAPSSTASVDDFTTAKLEVYPNPATSILNIVQDNFTEGAYTVTDITGKTVMQNNVSASNTQVNVESLTSGIYFLNLGDKHIKFIKK